MVHFRVMIPIVTSDTATPPFNHAEHTEVVPGLHVRSACQLVHQNVHVYRWVAGALQPPMCHCHRLAACVCLLDSHVSFPLSKPTNRQGGELKCWEKLAVGGAICDRSGSLRALPFMALPLLMWFPPS